MKRVLVVDDEPHVLRVLRLALERAGFRVECAADGVEALERLVASPPDAVLADVQMPRMGGVELCERIEAACPGKPSSILVMTSRVERDLREWAARQPRVQFLEKPVSPRAVVARLTEGFSRGAPDDERGGG